ncbi:hypothetical protein SAY86_023137 [Trapa natans]|uniref:Bidirectional sugar transporter SWEET n=1 Tax=Trapa natans TaxID=22666 RepID=A0AAN7LUI8_TRANT|nr:hypothetical protein SAY86_023137 [Trapa natans]
MAFPRIHHPLAFTFGVLGNIISLFVLMAPIPTFYRIWKKKSTEGFHSLPYLVTLFNSTLWLYYALIKGNAILLITINSIGCLLETVYIVLYLAYAPRHVRKSTVKYFVLMNLGAFSFFILVARYATHDRQTRAMVLGWICVAVSVCVFAAPMSILRQVIRTKSVEFMPFSLSLTLTLGAVMWFFYGLFSHDKCIYLPNIIGFFLGVVQMLLYALYRRAEAVIILEKVPPKSLVDTKVVDIPGEDEAAAGKEEVKADKPGAEDEDDDTTGPNGDSAV